MRRLVRWEERESKGDSDSRSGNGSKYESEGWIDSGGGVSEMIVIVTGTHYRFQGITDGDRPNGSESSS